MQLFAGEETPLRLLKLRDRVELLQSGRNRGLRMSIDGTRCLLLQVGVSEVVHQARVERRGVDRTGNTAREDDGGRERIIEQHDPLRQLALDQNRRVRGDSRRAPDEVVEAIVKEEGIRRVIAQPLGHF